MSAKAEGKVLSIIQCTSIAILQLAGALEAQTFHYSGIKQPKTKDEIGKANLGFCHSSLRAQRGNLVEVKE